MLREDYAISNQYTCPIPAKQGVEILNTLLFSTRVIASNTAATEAMKATLLFMIFSLIMGTGVIWSSLY